MLTVCVFILSTTFSVKPMFADPVVRLANAANCDAQQNKVDLLTESLSEAQATLNERNLKPAQKAALQREIASLKTKLIAAKQELKICTTPMPDLVIIPRAGGSGPNAFCNGNNDDLIVSVKNQGTATASGFTVKIDFARGGSAFATVASLGVNQTTQVKIKMLSSCFRPDCSCVR